MLLDSRATSRRQDRIDKGLVLGPTSKERSELTAANKRIGDRQQAREDHNGWGP